MGWDTDLKDRPRSYRSPFIQKGTQSVPLRRQLIKSYIVITVITIIVLGAYLSLSFMNKYQQILSSRALSEAKTVAEIVSDEYAIDPGRENMTALAQRFGYLTQTRVTIIRADGVVLGDSWSKPEYMGNLLGYPEVKDALREGAAVSFREALAGMGGPIRTTGAYGGGSDRVVYAAATFDLKEHVESENSGEAGRPGTPPNAKETEDLGVTGNDSFSSGNPMCGGVVRVGIPLTEVYFILSSMIWTILSAGGLAVVVSLLVGWRVSRNIISPVEAMTAAASRFARGDVDDEPLKDAVHTAFFQTSASEIWELANALSTMATGLKDRLVELEESKIRLETVLSHMVSGVILLDRDGRLKLANRASEEMLGFKAERFIGRPHLEATRNKVIEEAVREVLEDPENRVRSLEIQVTYPERRSLQVFLAPASAPLNGVLVVLHDITEIRHLESVRADFIANISHELKTPTTALMGFAETLLGGALSDERATQEFLETIYHESVRLARLVDDLLDLSRLESDPSALRKSSIDLGARIKTSIGKMIPRITAQDLTIEVYAPNEPIVINADPDRIDQVMINLVENCLKYSRPGGKIDVIVEALEGEAKVKVKDTGVGIPLADQPRVFERFYRVDRDRSRKKGGTGLGLAIVKHIVEAHGGSVDLISELGVGTTVSFTLPAS